VGKTAGWLPRSPPSPRALLYTDGCSLMCPLPLRSDLPEISSEKQAEIEALQRDIAAQEAHITSIGHDAAEFADLRIDCDM
jgi:hypothetical protein